ncbi:FadR/GntR family transcriptional regulator [Bordetella sp. 15P40C-2]|uniref:FadR/GntR family transcriptional regulator n=1 Tax=Bordetella sp. 15P40C-2 TaxID=2572246 RepID=UPI0013212FB1|nr:FadR/GntR family transcriptional regulator [Bordetella sp. 15P40C-2]MVW70099.1 GntR family transcriptional regulator [Bordetella sp. 15P40C-2]
MVNFAQIQRLEHLPAKIAAAIEQEIAAGRLKAGDKLPTEHALARTFGVSRSVVREAIAQLRNEGLIDTRQGVGAFVLDLQRRHVIRIDSNELANRESFRSLFQLRVPLEVEAAGLAALHHTAEDLERLDQALEIMRGMETRWTAEGVEADLEFHCALADGTQNAYYSMFVGFIGDKITNTIAVARARAELEQIVQITLAEHTAVRDAVASRDVLGARAAMHAHIMGAASRLDLQLDMPLRS